MRKRMLEVIINFVVIIGIFGGLIGSVQLYQIECTNIWLKLSSMLLFGPMVIASNIMMAIVAIFLIDIIKEIKDKK